jgi:hypothetical protein
LINILYMYNVQFKSYNIKIFTKFTNKYVYTSSHNIGHSNKYVVILI